MLTRAISSWFDSGVRSRGRSYQRNGQVKIVSFDPDGAFEAQVYGSDLYRVSVKTKQSNSTLEVSASCSCPYSDSTDGPCKHIWATLVTIENEYHLPKMLKRIRFHLLDKESDEGNLRRGPAESLPSHHRDSPYLSKLGLRLVGGPRAKSKPAKKVEEVPAWAKLLKSLAANSIPYEQKNLFGDPPLQPLYVLETGRLEERGGFLISLAQQNVTATGKLGKQKKLAITSADIPRMPDALDRQICLMLVGAGVPDYSYNYYRSFRGDHRGAQSVWCIPDDVRAELLPLLFSTTRFFLRAPDDSLAPLAWDEGQPWELFLAVDRSSTARQYELALKLRRGDECSGIMEVQYLLDGDPGLLIHHSVMSRLHTHGCYGWVRSLRRRGAVPVQESHRDKLLAELAKVKRLPPVAWPSEWGMTEVCDLAPKPELNLTMSEQGGAKARSYVGASVAFRYGDALVSPDDTRTILVDAAARRQLCRDASAERRSLNRLRELGMETDPYTGRLCILERRLPHLLAALLDEGWTVMGNRTLFRTAGDFSVHMGTGIDWFELNGAMDFGEGQSVPLPELLAAARKGERFVRLPDGSMGLLPQEWMAQHRSLLELGRIEDGQVRFAKTQIGLIDALLAAMPQATFDQNMAAAREKMHSFNGIQPRKPRAEFIGTLRPYQQYGLAWLNFLDDFSWGGCLADDMGLGKTIQLLALIVDRKQLGDTGPSLVIMPKSLVFNWIRESQRFAPGLRVLDYTGGEREAVRENLAEYDLVFTTYGTLKRDIEFLSQREFNYVVLDEAQAIKNPQSQNAKAARLLKARRRLVMTGTPVENHLGDLWSLFEFLNPGMLGSANAFKGAFGNGRATVEENGRLPILHRTLRPFILRRTKDQVAPELPKRSEQTIECTMPAKQAAYYKELRDYYRESLLGRIEKHGMAKSKVHVLEALLRLRQAACHPGLIDKSKAELETAKMEAFLPMISELVEEGHKALIFSQFVKMLAIVRKEIEGLGIAYEYLDGQTDHRQECVDRFQTDPKCPLFLISLKAGGTGLNLTAADYVIILDPWWNPAVEAQAIDRTHRIGQDKSIIAYRIITRDTVEAKILELQKSKRDLADAIITEANSLIQNLTRDDLALLLS